MSLDIPYYKGTRWRFKVDFKAQQNPTNLYFGLTESTLRPLRLPSTPREDQRIVLIQNMIARKTLRSGEVGEAPL
jgi:hypothetical protein